MTIVGLIAGDTVTIYDAPSGGNILASETIDGKGTTITLSTNLSDNAGIIYLTVPGGKAESKWVNVTFMAATFKRRPAGRYLSDR